MSPPPISDKQASLIRGLVYRYYKKEFVGQTNLDSFIGFLCKKLLYNKPGYINLYDLNKVQASKVINLIKQKYE